MIREYRHLLLLLWGGKGNEVNGVTNVYPGELAMECLACPQPNVNLPEGWQLVPAAKMYVPSPRLKTLANQSPGICTARLWVLTQTFG